MNRWKKVQDLLEGDVLAEDIIDGEKIIFKKGEILDKSKIEALFKIGIEWVCVKVIDFHDVEDLLVERNIDLLLNHEITEYAKKKVEDIFEEVKTEEKFNPKVVEELSNVISESIIFNSKKNVFLNLVKLREYSEYTFTHQLNVAILSTLISLELGLNKDVIKRITFSSLIHDIGKLKIPLNILNASRSLTPEEFETIKLHTLFGRKIALDSGVKDELILSGIAQHHEKMNGNGYPKQLKDDEIHLSARVIAVADIYDALISERPYKKAWNPYEAMSNLIRSIDAFDSRIISVLVRILGLYPPGTKVSLSNGRRCVVIGTKKGQVLRPVILCENGEILDLSLRKDLKIVKVG